MMMSCRMSVVRRACLIVGAALGMAFLSPTAFAWQNQEAAPPNPPIATPDGAWVMLPAHAPEVQAADPWVRPMRGQALVLNTLVMRNLLAAAPREYSDRAVLSPLVISLPDPDGVLRQFAIVDSPVMEPGLAAQFPDIKTYVGQGLDDRAATIRLDMTPQGFHAQVRTPRGHWFIDPFCRADDTHYTSYYKKNLKPTFQWSCGVTEQSPAPPDWEPAPPAGGVGILTSGPSLKTYRVAVACTGEYATFQGGTVPLAQAAIVTAVNRVTGVYETELAIRLTLIANNSSIVYLSSATDPYTNNNGTTMLSQNQSNLTSVIGGANYDIGHVFSTGGGGIAGLGVVCSSTLKAEGVTGSPSPTGDAFWIDYVAHEMGHQFGGDHAFNGINGSCTGGNRNASTAYEPGSGTTIMNYAGICGADDLQAHSDAYFSFISQQEIRAFVTTGGGNGCGTATNTGNSAPTISAPNISGKTIPKGTPFALTATGSDPNGDALTYCWEERDLGAAQALSAADNGTSPLTRSFNPTTNPTRTVPQISKILAGTSDTSEKLPNLARASFGWTVTARDNRAGGGGVERADVTFAVTAAAGPFTVTSPSSAVSWAAGSTQTVTWNVAGTTANGVNTASVSILLSTDGGNTFPITLVASTANTGTASFTVPNNQTSTGRIKVQPIGNIYFNIAPGTVTITPPVNGVVLGGTGNNSISDSTGNGNSNGRIDPGENTIGISVRVGNTGNQAATGVSATLSSLSPAVTVTTATSAYPDLAPGGSAVNTLGFFISVGAGHVCGTPVNLRLSITSAQATGTYDFSFPTGTAGGTTTQTFTYSGAVVPILDNTPAGANATLAISGLTGTITDVNFRFNGTTCSSAIGATTVGLDHTWIGDLIVTLRSPSGTPVILMNRPNSSGDGNNFCQTVLDDSGASPIQSVSTAQNPYTGTFSPANPLSAFVGQSANGTWTLNVADVATTDTGNIRSFSIIVTTTNPASCDPPISGPTCPGITGNPSSTAACPGTGATFTASASGTAPLGFQWRKGGFDISGATSSTFSIPSVTGADADSYDCVVTNACGSATTTSATLTVNSAPTITLNPSGTTVCQGSSFSLTAGASGTAPLSFQWRKGGFNVPGATSSVFTIAAAGVGDTASYDCLVTNTCGSAPTSAAVVTVNASTTITSQPSPQTVCAGSPASFTVGAGGSGSLTFQWRKGSVNIGGATNATLTIPAAAAGDAASYDCVVTGSCGSATSSAVTLTVNPATAVTSNPSNSTVCTGSPASFSVGATGAGTLTYQWRKGSVNIGGATSSTFTIPAAAAGDAAFYDCVVTGSCGSATSTAASLTVDSATQITSQPSTQTICAGSPASFSVGATGAGTLTYQWRKGGVNIGGATSSTFSIPSTVAGDGASYDCVVAATCGSVTSTAASLVVNATTSVGVQPSSATVCAGSPASFTVSGAGTGPFSFQWRKGGLPIGGATSATLSIPSAAAGDAGSYDCVVTGACGSATSTADTLVVNAAPTISSDPSPTTVCNGSPASFTVAASGTAPLTFSWRKGGVPIPGANASTFSIPSVTSTDAGGYDCVVTNTCGSVTTAAATLTVNPGTAITSQPAPAQVCTGGPASFTVGATGTGTLTYQWRKGGTPIPGASSSTYSILSAIAGDADSYDCVVSSDCGSATSSSASLAVNAPVSITANPSDRTLCVGDVLSLSVSANGAAPLSYQWRHAGSPISGATSATFSIPSSAPSDAGSYDCIVSNPCGPVTSGAASVVVNSLPDFTLNPVGASICVGQPATLVVSVASSTPVTLQWRHAGSPLAGETSSTLDIPAAATTDAGSYDCVATNTCGQTTSTAVTLAVNVLPQILVDPSDLTLLVAHDGSFSVVLASEVGVTFQWSRDGSPISDGPTPGGGAYSGCTTSTLTITNAGETDAGSYTVSATNSCGSVTSNSGVLTINTTPGCAADFNGDGDVNPDDLADYITCFFTDPPCDRADFNQDSNVNPDDLADYITLFFSGGC